MARGQEVAREQANAASDAMDRAHRRPFEPTDDSLASHVAAEVKKLAPDYREFALAGAEHPAPAWPMSQAIAGELDHAALTGDYTRVDQMLNSLQGDWQPGPNGVGGYATHPLAAHGDHQNRFYDDNAWIGLDLMQAYRQTGNKKYLERAEALVPFMRTGFVEGGGIRWNEQDWTADASGATLNTAAVAPSMQFFLALHEATQKPEYLDDARHMERGLDKLRGLDGLYRDNLKISNPADDNPGRQRPFSYNQGASLGAYLQLADATKDPNEKQHYLDLAQQTANAWLDKCDQDPSLMWGHSPSFNAIFFRNLMKLDTVRPNPRAYEALNNYVEDLQRYAVDPASGQLTRHLPPEVAEAQGVPPELRGHPGLRKMPDGRWVEAGRYDAYDSTLIDHGAYLQLVSLRGMSDAQLKQVA